MAPGPLPTIIIAADSEVMPCTEISTAGLIVDWRFAHRSRRQLWKG